MHQSGVSLDAFAPCSSIVSTEANSAMPYLARFPIASHLYLHVSCNDDQTQCADKQKAKLLCVKKLDQLSHIFIGVGYQHGYAPKPG